MTGIEAYRNLQSLKFTFALKAISSTVDETKSLHDMLEEWKIYFRLNPDMQVRAILKYNVEKDFPAVFSNKKIESEEV